MYYSKGFKIILVGIVMAIILGLVGVLFIYKKSNKTDSPVNNEVASIVEQVGKIIILPKDEEPTVATVSDLEKVKDQPFFANAKVGDSILIYVKAQKIFLYRSTDKKLIEVAPLSSSEQPNIE